MDPIKLLLENAASVYQYSFSYKYECWKRWHCLVGSLRRESEAVKNYSGTIKILDIGCGGGGFIYTAKARLDKKFNLYFTGIDLSSFKIDFAEKRKEYHNLNGCDFQVMDAAKLAFKDGEFDIVICSELVEHMADPLQALKEIYRVLKSGGLAVVTTPNGGGSVIAKILKFINILSFGMIKKYNQKKAEKAIDENRGIFIYTSSDGGASGAGHGHVSVQKRREWLKLFKESKFKTQLSAGTGGILFGGPNLDGHRFLFALTVILDTLLERLPFSYLWYETLLFELRKKC